MSCISNGKRYALIQALWDIGFRISLVLYGIQFALVFLIVHDATSHGITNDPIIVTISSITCIAIILMPLYTYWLDYRNLNAQGDGGR